MTVTVTDDHGCAAYYTDYVTVSSCCTPSTQVLDVSAVKIDENETLFTWSPVSDPCHSFYKILRATDPSSPAFFGEVGETRTTNFTESIIPGQVYYYEIASSGCSDLIGPF